MFWRIFLESAATIFSLVVIAWGIYKALTRNKATDRD